MNNVGQNQIAKICVIDAMVDIKCEGIDSSRFQLFTELSSEEALIYRKDNGHGNAVCSIIHEKQKDVVILFFPVTNSDSPERIAKILEYIQLNKLSRIVNLSLGFFSYTDGMKLLEYMCKKLLENDIYIVAAQPQQNAYPACFNSVIGVSVDMNVKNFLFKSTCGNIQIIMKDKKRVLWWGKNYVIEDSGSSFATAEMASILTGCIYGLEGIKNSEKEVWKQIELSIGRKL